MGTAPQKGNLSNKLRGNSNRPFRTNAVAYYWVKDLGSTNLEIGRKFSRDPSKIPRCKAEGFTSSRPGNLEVREKRPFGPLEVSICSALSYKGFSVLSLLQLLKDTSRGVPVSLTFPIKSNINGGARLSRRVPNCPSQMARLKTIV